MAENDNGGLAPPQRTSVDPGAHDLESNSSDSDDHFSDAQSGLDQNSGNASPLVPLTRVEKIDDKPSHGEVPGTEAYNKRERDAGPDKVAVVLDANDLELNPSSPIPKTLGWQPISTTLVEKMDSFSPSHGEAPGTIVHEKRAADAVPDMVVKSWKENYPSSQESEAASTPGDLPIPVTKVEKVDSEPSHGEVPGTKAFEMRRGDAEPDLVEEVGDIKGSPTSPISRSSIINHSRRKSSGAGRKTATEDDLEDEGLERDDFGDDFDDFEEGEDDAEFGDFDDGFQEVASTPAPQALPTTSSFPVLDFAQLHSVDEVQAATNPYMNALFPPDTIDTSVLPPLSTENSVFLTPRSASLWAQLVAPPPLQPPNWIRSRIRRLFLVSLGVPVDLDEILPASKQKKLILPSIHLHPASGSPRTSTDSRSISRLKQNDGNASSTSIDSQGKPSRSDSKRRKGPASAPHLDLVSARQLCMITDEALKGLTMEELKEHVVKLEKMQGTAQEVLSYWTKRTDEKLGDREAFEGVIENLVKHARKVRK